MSLGLAYADNAGLYLAIESKGVSADEDILPDGSARLGKKLRQTSSLSFVLCTGHIWPWADALRRFESQVVKEDSIELIARRLTALLNESPFDKQCPSFGLVCGFQEKEPICWRLQRYQNPKLENLAIVQPIGEPALAETSAKFAKQLIKTGTPPLAALVRAIKAQMPHHELCEPIVSVMFPTPL